jgi:DNA polymerase
MSTTNSPGAAPFLPPVHSLKVMSAAVQRCEGCELYKWATQAVFGEGRQSAKLLMIGEQPGNEEDLKGKPFVGPSGKLLDRALTEAGIDRKTIYLTNAVKHFKFEERGKRRLHKKPRASEIQACHPWLEAEIEAVHPAVIACLGATAAQSILGSAFRLTENRGRAIEHPLAPHVVATVHPSAILRIPDSRHRELEFAHFVRDLQVIRSLVAEPSAHPRAPA